MEDRNIFFWERDSVFMKYFQSELVWSKAIGYSSFSILLYCFLNILFSDFILRIQFLLSIGDEI